MPRHGFFPILSPLFVSHIANKIEYQETDMGMGRKRSVLKMKRKNNQRKKKARLKALIANSKKK